MIAKNRNSEFSIRRKLCENSLKVHEFLEENIYYNKTHLKKHNRKVSGRWLTPT